ncbi:hypothetical protein NL676_037036 [Syzygium grande]|nr:hypothetical protein NL676_037036 [Syzygium grande]
MGECRGRIGRVELELRGQSWLGDAAAIAVSEIRHQCRGWGLPIDSIPTTGKRKGSRGNESDMLKDGKEEKGEGAAVRVVSMDTVQAEMVESSLKDLKAKAKEKKKGLVTAKRVLVLFMMTLSTSTEPTFGWLQSKAKATSRPSLSFCLISCGLCKKGKLHL